jgi:hypothetical protein
MTSSNRFQSLLLLAGLTVTSIANAQTGAVPATKPAAPAKAPAAAAPAVASTSAGIDRANCDGDLKVDEAKLRKSIIAAIQKGAKNYSPAIAYEDQSNAGTLQVTNQGINQRAEKQAQALSSALMAAVESKENPANGASKSLFKNEKRRASLDVRMRCTGRDPQPVRYIDNQKINQSCGGSGISFFSPSPQDIGINITQVYQTSWSSEKVATAFARAKLESDADNTVRACMGERNSCMSPANYRQINSERFVLDDKTMNRDVFFVDSTKIQAGMSPMVSYSAMRVSKVPVCGSDIYLLTAFGNGHKLGLERSSLVGLVARIGDKTVVIGNGSAQSWKIDQDEPWPLWLPKDPSGLQRKALGGLHPDTREEQGYLAIARKIGSTEKTYNGIVGGAQASPNESPRQRVTSVR